MGEKELRSYTDEARTKGWGSQTLVQKARMMAQELHAPALARLRSEERTLLYAVNHLATHPEELNFVRRVCRETHDSDSCNETMNMLRNSVAEHGGVPTFLNSMARLRVKAALAAPQRMQRTALAEITRVFRGTFEELILPTQISKVNRRVEAWAKEGGRLSVRPLAPEVFGEKSAAQYAEHLSAVLRKQHGIGVVVEALRLCPGLTATSPETSAARLAERLEPLVACAAETNGRLLLESTRCDLQPIVPEALRRVLDKPQFYGAEAEPELVGSSYASRALLRELVQWGAERAKRGAPPLRVHITRGRHYREDAACAAVYGPAVQICPEDEAGAFFARLITAAMECPADAVTPVTESTDPVYLCYAVLCWARNGRKGMPPISVRLGLGNHLARSMARLGCETELTAAMAAQGESYGIFDRYLPDVLEELVFNGGFNPALYTADTAAIDWDALAKPLRVACSTPSDAELPPQPAPPPGPGFLGRLLSRAEVDAFYAAAAEEIDRPQAPLPLRPGGTELRSPLSCIHRSLTAPGAESYRFIGADYAAIDAALTMAQERAGDIAAVSAEDRVSRLRKAARALSERYTEFCALLVRDSGFTLDDAARELRDASDALRFTARYLERWQDSRDGSSMQAAGVVAVAGSPAHPLAYAARDVAEAWASGNPVIFRPAPYTTLVGTRFAELLRAVGIEVFCLPCMGHELSRRLMTDKRVRVLLCTGTREEAGRLACALPTCSVLCSPAEPPPVYLAADCDWRTALRQVVPAFLRRSGQSPQAPHTLLVHAQIYDHPLFRSVLEEMLTLPHAKPTHLQGAGLGPLSAPLSDAQEALLTDLPGGEDAWWVLPKADAPKSLLYTPGLCAHADMPDYPFATADTLPLLGLIRVQSTADAALRQQRLSHGSRAVIYAGDSEEIAAWESAVDCRCVGINCCPPFRVGAFPLPMHSAGVCRTAGVLSGTPDALTELCDWTEQTRPGLRSARRALSFDPKDILPVSADATEAMRLSAAADSISYWWEKEYAAPRALPPAELMQATLEYRPVSECLRVEKNLPDADVAILLMAAMQARARLRVSCAAPRAWLSTFSERTGIPVFTASRAETEASVADSAAAEVCVLRDPAATPETLRLASSAGFSVITAPASANARIELPRHLRQYLRILPAPQR